MGGPGIPQAPRTNQGGGGTMGILMPLYTTGIVIFFVYTVMNIYYVCVFIEKIIGYF